MGKWNPRWRALSAAGCMVLMSNMTALADSGKPEVTVRIQSSQAEAVVPSTAIGMNTATWDANLSDKTVPNLLKNAGVKVLRYPGGSTSDVYHWKTNSLTDGQSGATWPQADFNHFMTLVHKSNGEAMITVNYGSNQAGTAGGSVQEAANWVRYANVTHHDQVMYWEIGNEIYGNGSYGSKWEEDLHANKGPAAYAKHALQFITAMTKVDPHIRIGVVLTAPGNWPDGQQPSWNDTVLQAIGSKIDFVDVHWYAQQPGQESDAGLLQSTSTIPAMVSTLNQEINQYCGKRAKDVKIMVTETNSVAYNPGKQTTSIVNALFLGDNYASWLSQGVVNVDWWGLFNGPVTGTNNDASLYGKNNYGDYGLLSVGQDPEPRADTTFPTYWGLVLVNRWIAPGDTIVSADSSAPDIVVHASVSYNKTTTKVMLLNDSAETSHTVALTGQGWSNGAAVTVDLYDSKLSHIERSSATVVAGRVVVQLPPYSMMVVQVH